MDLGLRGRVAIVAAASKGLGRAVAEELAREGADIAICSRTAADLEKAASRIRCAGCRQRGGHAIRRRSRAKIWTAGYLRYEFGRAPV